MKKKNIIIAWVLGVPAVAIFIFMLLSIIFYQEPGERFQNDGNVAELLREVEKLEQDLKKDPKQLHKQRLLAHSYQVMGRYPEAIAAYGRAWKLVEKSPDDLVRFAEALYRQKGNQFTGKPLELLNQALNLNGQHINGLILHGTAMLQQKNNVQAVKDWTLANSLLPDNDARKAELQKMIKQMP